MTADTPAVEIRALLKTFGAARALDGIDLTVEPGSVFGFLGPNGAGKSTTLSILTGLARPTAGEARVLGHDVTTAPREVRAAIGYLPDVPGFYAWMTARELLRFCGELFAIPEPVLGERIDALLDLSGLRGVDTRVGGYSRGMRQRLGLAQALINAPRLLLLDEPTSALDPLGRKAMLDMILALRGRTTVFFSTHILADVERVCDTIAILDRGKVVIESSIDELRHQREFHPFVVELASADDAERLCAAIAGERWLRAVEREDATLRCAVVDVPAAERSIPAAVAALGLPLRRFEAGEPTLEEVFVDLVGERR